MLRLKTLKITPPSIVSGNGNKTLIKHNIFSKPCLATTKVFQRSFLIKKHKKAFDEIVQDERLKRKMFLHEDEDDLEQENDINQWLFGSADARDRLREYEKNKLLPEKYKQEARELIDRMDTLFGKPPEQERLDKTITMKHLLNVGRHIKITSSGRVQSFSALVVGGNGQGTGGIGYGKAITVQQATEKAWKDLQKNLVSIYRHEDRTVPHPIKVKVGPIQLLLKPRKKGAGMVGNPLLMQVSECFGLDDVMIKVISRQKNPKRMLQAYLYALTERIEPPQEKARRLGKKYVDLTKVWKPQRPFALRDEFEIPDNYVQDVSRLTSAHKKEVSEEDQETEEESKNEIDALEALRNYTFDQLQELDIEPTEEDSTEAKQS